MIVAVKLLMTLATLLFVAGWTQARRDLRRHRALMLSGVLSFLGIAVVLVVGVHFFGQSYAPAAWLVGAFGEAGAWNVLRAHRALATVSAVLLLAQAFTGWRRRPVHPRMARWTAAFWLASFVSGLAVFV